MGSASATRALAAACTQRAASRLQCHQGRVAQDLEGYAVPQGQTDGSRDGCAEAAAAGQGSAGGAVAWEATSATEAASASAIVEIEQVSPGLLAVPPSPSQR